jgi:hypothetical protein
MAKKQTTYSVLQVSQITGFSRAWVSRLCQHGVIGRKIAIPETDQHIFRLSAKDISTLKARKNQGIRNSADKD